MSIRRGFINKSIAALLNNEKHSDVQFKFRNSDVTYFAHKYILRLTSNVFDTMFYGAIKTENDDPIEIVDVSPENFLLMLTFMYTEQVTLSTQNLPSIFYAAHKYNVEQLEFECIDFLTKDINVDNVCFYSEQLYIYGALKDKCLQFIDVNINKLIQREHIYDLSEELLIEIVKRDSIQIEEVDLFKFLLKWAEKSCQKQDRYVPVPKLKEAFVVFNMLRFPTLKFAEFAECLKHQPDFFTSEEIGRIYKYASTGIRDENLIFPITKRHYQPHVKVIFSGTIEFFKDVIQGYDYEYEFTFTVKMPLTIYELNVLIFKNFRTIIKLFKMEKEDEKRNWKLIFAQYNQTDNLMICEPEIQLIPNVEYTLNSLVQCNNYNDNMKCYCVYKTASSSSDVFNLPKDLKTFVRKILYKRQSLKRKYED